MKTDAEGFHGSLKLFVEGLLCTTRDFARYFYIHSQLFLEII